MAEMYTGDTGTPYFGGGVYYRLLQMRNGLITVATVQDFDEYDYDHNKYVKDSSGESYMFDEEEYAIEKLNEWYRPKEIDPEFRKGYVEDDINDNTFLIR